MTINHNEITKEVLHLLTLWNIEHAVKRQLLARTLDRCLIDFDESRVISVLLCETSLDNDLLSLL